jgi:hypothetical protein
LIPRRTHRLLLAGALLAPITLVACGSSSSDASGGSPTTTSSSGESAETYVVVPDSQVTAGLAVINANAVKAAATIAAGQDAKSTVDAMYAKWASIEGTIKQNEVEMYLDFEDALGSMQNANKDKDKVAAAAAVADFAKTSAQYLAKHR